jgi:hypothetical protein
MQIGNLILEPHDIVRTVGVGVAVCLLAAVAVGLAIAKPQDPATAVILQRSYDRLATAGGNAACALVAEVAAASGGAAILPVAKSFLDHVNRKAAAGMCAAERQALAATIGSDGPSRRAVAPASEAPLGRALVLIEQHRVSSAAACQKATDTAQRFAALLAGSEADGRLVRVVRRAGFLGVAVDAGDGAHAGEIRDLIRARVGARGTGSDAYAEIGRPWSVDETCRVVMPVGDSAHA